MKTLPSLPSWMRPGNWTSLRWASKTLALLLSLMAGSLAFMLLAGGILYFLSTFRYFVFMALFTAISLGAVTLAAYLYPRVRAFLARALTVGNGRKRLVQAAGVLWFLLFSYWAATEADISKEIAATALSSSILVLIGSISHAIVKQGRLRIVSLVAGFLCIIVLYGAIYSLIFLGRPLSFTFSPGISEGMALQRSFTSSLQLLRVLEHQYFLALALESNPRIGYAALMAHRQGNGSPVPLSVRTTIRFAAIPDPPGGDEIHLIISYHGADVDLSVRGGRIQNPEHGLVSRLYGSATPEDFKLRLRDLLNSLEAKIARERRQLEAVFAGRPEWDLADFCYFSTITMTTVGYGDILPNSSLVRLVVMSEAVMGMAYAAFIIALIRGD